MYNIADESVQFSPTQLFIQSRRGCSASNGQGVQLGRYIQLKSATAMSISLLYLARYLRSIVRSIALTLPS